MLVKKQVPNFVTMAVKDLSLSECSYEVDFTAEFEEDKSILMFARAMLRPNPSNRDLEAGLNCLNWYPSRKKYKSYDKYNFNAN